MSDIILDEIFAVIKARKNADASDSYVATLLDKGTEKIAEKVGEEAIEVIIEAIKGDKNALKAESADLLFHLLVLLADQGLTPKDVLTILQERMGTSGHAEKATRN